MFKEKVKKPARSALIFFFLISCSGCQSLALDQAFEGKFAPRENNKIINEYCQGCHVHNTFSPDLHVKEISRKYKNPDYQEAKECRVCHYLKKNFLSEPSRLTRRP